MIRDKILGAQDLKSEEVFIDEWDVAVIVREMSAGAREEVMRRYMAVEKGEADSVTAFVVAKCVFDPETGDRVFTDADIPALAEKNSKAIDKICEVANRLSGLGDDAAEEAAKN